MQFSNAAKSKEVEAHRIKRCFGGTLHLLKHHLQHFQLMMQISLCSSPAEGVGGTQTVSQIKMELQPTAGAVAKQP